MSTFLALIQLEDYDAIRYVQHLWADNIDAHGLVGDYIRIGEDNNLDGMVSWENWRPFRVSANDVLTKDNTSVYTPTADYQPATKKYVDDKVASSGGGGSTKSVTISTSAEWDEMVAKPDWGGVEIVYLNANIESSIRIIDVPKNVIKIMGMFTDTVSVKKITHSAGAVLRGHSGATIANVYVDEPVTGFGVVIGCENQDTPGFPMGTNLLVVGSMTEIPGEIIINPA